MNQQSNSGNPAQYVMSQAAQSVSFGSLSTAREMPLLEAQANRLNAHAQEIDLAAQRLAVLADRILGAQPETASKGEAKGPAPDSALWKLNGAHEWMEAARHRLLLAIERLEIL